MMRYVDLLTHKLSAGKMLESDKAPAKLYESDKVYYASELLKMVKIRNTYREGKYEPRCENDRRIGTNM